MYTIYKISYLTNITINKESYKRTIQKTHSKKFKSKYNNHINKHLRLSYQVDYNWLTELIRVTKFNNWHLFQDTNAPVLHLSSKTLQELPKYFVNLPT